MQEICKIIKNQTLDVNGLSAIIDQFHTISSNECGCWLVHCPFSQRQIQVEPLAKPKAYSVKRWK